MRDARHPARARRGAGGDRGDARLGAHAGGGDVKYADEFRDPVAAKGAARGHQAGVRRHRRHRRAPAAHHGDLRRPYPCDLPLRPRRAHAAGSSSSSTGRAARSACCRWAGSTTASSIAERPEVIFTTFGDAMRVPGTRKSLLQAKADGADVRMVYSPLDALALARRNPDREVIFFGLGFETTMPSTALTILQAAAEGISNFSVFCNHITVPPPIKALLDDPRMRPRRLRRPRACLDGDRHQALRVHRARLPASRSWWRASSRSTCCSRC